VRHFRRSIDVRNPHVDPINLVQVDLRRRMRAGGQSPALRAARRRPPDRFGALTQRTEAGTPPAAAS
jgi:hypothetical protein